MRSREQLTSIEAAAFVFGRTLGAAVQLDLIGREHIEELTQRASSLVAAMAKDRNELAAATRRFQEGIDAGVTAADRGKTEASDIWTELARLQKQLAI